jgi:aminopeptidase N
MENTSATTLTDGTLYTDATENIRSSESLVAHEMAHQWFGDYVTCKDWSHVWLNEGFATYYAALWEGHKHGRDQLLFALYQDARQVTGVANDTEAVVRRTYKAPRDMFGYLAYPKGGWVLHMLRSQLGDELYRRCIKTYLERHAYGNVVTEDLRSVIEELSSRSFDQFFDQWVYHAHHPELEVSYSWDEPSKVARISVRQNQKLSDSVLLFDLPLTMRFKGKFGKADRTLHVTQADEDFYFPLESAPEIARLDPEYTFLGTVNFKLPNPMLSAQLADKADMIGRLFAVEKFASRTDKDAVAKLKQTLNQDDFYGVRIEASKALRSIHSDEAFSALQASLEQPDARVRRQVVADIGGFYREPAFDSASKTLDHEKNPDILSSAIRNLAGYSKPEVHEALLKYLKTPSYRNELSDAAISAMRSQDDPAYIAPLLEYLPQHEHDYTSRGFAQALGAVAYLARNEEKKEQVRVFLTPFVNSKKRSVQFASINALGTLGDPKAIVVLESFTTASKENRERQAAERAVADLRAARKPVDDFKNLRQEVLDLQKSNRELKKDIEDLKKKLDERTSAPAPPAEQSSKKKKSAPNPPKHS